MLKCTTRGALGGDGADHWASYEHGKETEYAWIFETLQGV